MLKQLRIQNLAVVEDVVLEFDAGLNVLTGSTGAGKSLILGAVNLLLGHRGGAGLIRAGEDRAVVEGRFVNPAGPGSMGASVTVRREVRRGGRSLAFVDDAPVPLKQLQTVCSRWIEPHGQNEQLRLRDPNAHVGYVDAFAKNGDRLEDYRKALGSYRRAEEELIEFERRAAALKEKEELLRHRIVELERAAIREGELEALDRAIRLMENSERIYEALGQVHAALDDEEAGAVSALAQSIKRLERVADVDERISNFVSQLEEAELTLRDCADGVRSYIDGFEYDPERLRSMQDRRAYLFELERRYGMDADELVRMKEEWAAELEGVTFEDDRRRELSRGVDEASRALQREADRLSASRKTAAKKLDRLMTSELEALMISGARFRTEFEHEPGNDGPLRFGGVPAAARPDGADIIRFMVRTNPGESEGPLDEIASTGEISRISLALKKSVHADHGAGRQRPVLIFDELDAGVGADLGGVIAEKLLELSAVYQIICITHMPQIAAVGRRHLVVAKRSAKGRTFAQVATVKGTERRGEIARMLGGQDGSDKRIELAGEMLRSGDKKRKNVRP